MTKYIMSPYLPHATQKKDGSQPSHRAGWAIMWGKQLNATLIHNNDIPNDCQMLYLEPGMEFNGELKSFNMALSGTMWDGLYKRMKRIADYVDHGGKITTVEHTINGTTIVDWGERLYRRKKNYDIQIPKGKAGPKFGTLFPKDVANISKGTMVGTPAVYQHNFDYNKLTFGDSHVLSTWLPGSKCSRNDGLTLNGAIKRGFDLYINQMEMGDTFNTLRLYMGNIDIRHHLYRINETQEKAVLETISLADRYIHEILRIKNKYRINNIEVIELLPVEHESRRLPKTGFYKKKPFYGTWEQRNELVNIFNHVLQQGAKHYGGYTTIPWPTEYVHHTEVTICGGEVSGIFKEYKNQDLTFKKGMLRFSVMEKPHSVHVAPSFYLWSI